MIRLSEVAQKLAELLRASNRSEQAYRNAMTQVTEGSEKALFIFFWQEHAKMVCQLEDKIRWLGGVVDEASREPAWGNLSFREDIGEAEMALALADCERRDAELLNHYEFIAKTPLPVDVRSVLKVHILKIKSIQVRVLERLTRLNHASVHEGVVGVVNFHSGDAEDGILGQVVLQS